VYKGIVDLVNDKAKYSALFDLGLIAVFGIVAYFIEGEQFDKYKALKFTYRSLRKILNISFFVREFSRISIFLTTKYTKDSQRNTKGNYELLITIE